MGDLLLLYQNLPFDVRATKNTAAQKWYIDLGKWLNIFLACISINCELTCIISQYAYIDINLLDGQSLMQFNH